MVHERTVQNVKQSMILHFVFSINILSLCILLNYNFPLFQCRAKKVKKTFIILFDGTKAANIIVWCGGPWTSDHFGAIIEQNKAWVQRSLANRI